MNRSWLCAFFVGAIASFASAAELKKIDLKDVPEGIRKLADKAVSGAKWQVALKEDRGIDIQTGTSEDIWMLIGVNPKGSRVYVLYSAYGGLEGGTEIPQDQLPTAVREALKSSEINPTVVYAVNAVGAMKGDRSAKYYHVQAEPRDGKTAVARFDPTGQPHQTDLIVPSAGAGGSKLEFQKVTSEAGRFAAEMPGKPVEKIDEFTRPSDKAQFKFHEFKVNLGGDTGFIINYFDWPNADVKGKDPQKVMQAFQQNAKKSSAAEIMEERPIALGKAKVPGRYFLIAIKQRHVREQNYLAGNRLYRLIAVGSKDFIGSEAADRFFDSFTLIE